MRFFLERSCVTLATWNGNMCESLVSPNGVVGAIEKHHDFK
jgi:hypothetical protein